ncbi:MAG: thioredoxin fold domain-containing protein [Deltaproteobacteria bacterium]|nr:thioredoxin fold domain-containing protein [Deltaproteobacteria bacterium]
MKKRVGILTTTGVFLPLLLCVMLASSCNAGKPGSAVPEVPVKGMVTMVDLGATECIPCKMMAPIMAELEKEYAGKAAIVFIDVWEHREEAPKHGIRAIPTQIFFDKEGKEVFRHEGFMDKRAIVAMLEKLGVQK